MDVVGGVCAILQLVDRLGTTVINVSQAYSEITGMDELLRDFDSQLDATQMHLSFIGNGLRGGNLGESMQAWWSEAELERLLLSCEQFYGRLYDIFVKISRQRSSAAALRAWVRTKRYDTDISHLRRCITTCTNALQLPVIIQNIHSSAQTRSPALSEGEVPRLLEQLIDRMASLESSVAHTEHDLVTRGLQRSQDSFVGPQLSGIEQMVRELKLEMSALAATQQSQNPTTSSETEEQLAQIQATISKLRADVTQAEQDKDDNQSPADPDDTEQRIALEHDTRSMLDLMKGLVGHAKYYASTVDGASTSSKLTRRLSTTRGTASSARGSRLLHSISFGQPLDLPIQLSQKKREGIENWAGDIDADDNDSVATMSTISRLHSARSETTTTTHQSNSSVTTISANSLIGELHQRRIRAVESMMRAKAYRKAIPHLDRLLSSTDDSHDAREDARLTRSLAKALVETQPNGELIESYCKKFPAIATKVDEFRLENALRLLRQGSYAQVDLLLRPYKSDDCDTTDSAGSAVRQRIKLVLAQVLFCSSPQENKHKVIPILEGLIGLAELDPADEGTAHELLARAYYLKLDFGNAKEHGVQACQIRINTIGRDDEVTIACIALMVDICYDSRDPDEDLWRDMLPVPTASDGVPSDRLPFSVWRVKHSSEVQTRLRSCCEQVQRLAAKNPREAANHGIEFLKHHYDVSDFGLFAYEPVLCWQFLCEHISSASTLAAFKPGAVCPEHRREGSQVTGFSPIHFFAAATPKSGVWETRREDNCIEEISILLGITKKAEPDRETLSQMINAPMDSHWPLEQSLDGLLATMELTPLWVAATSGRLETVAFFLSLKETVIARGAESLTIMERARLRSRKRSVSILRAFNALSRQEALSVLATKSRDWHWCFAHPSMIRDLLHKCGPGSGNLQVQIIHPRDPQGTTTEASQSRDCRSLLEIFVSVIWPENNGVVTEGAQSDYMAMLKILSSHWETKEVELVVMNTLADYISVGVSFMCTPPRTPPLKPNSWINLWADMLMELLKSGAEMDARNAGMLQCSVDNLTRCTIPESEMQDMETRIKEEIEKQDARLEGRHWWTRVLPGSEGRRRKIEAEREMLLAQMSHLGEQKVSDGEKFVVRDKILEVMREQGRERMVEEEGALTDG
ncbi:hypothetical protein ACJ41O_003922 [Fusarium nematophilum]